MGYFFASLDQHPVRTIVALIIASSAFKALVTGGVTLLCKLIKNKP